MLPHQKLILVQLYMDAVEFLSAESQTNSYSGKL